MTEKIKEKVLKTKVHMQGPGNKALCGNVKAVGGQITGDSKGVTCNNCLKSIQIGIRKVTSQPKSE